MSDVTPTGHVTLATPSFSELNPSPMSNMSMAYGVHTQARRQGGCKGVHVHPPYLK